MMADIQKCAPDDPNRCQAVHSQGQCLNLAAPESKYCLAHGGNKGAQVSKAQQLRNYQLTRWRSDVERSANSPQIKSLREEIGICRIVLETTLNRCDSETDLMLKSHTISDLVSRIERLVISCHKLEDQMGNLLDKTQILQFSQELIRLITQIENDETKIKAISDGIIEIATRLTTDEQTISDPK